MEIEEKLARELVTSTQRGESIPIQKTMRLAMAILEAAEHIAKLERRIARLERGATMKFEEYALSLFESYERRTNAERGKTWKK